MSKEVAVLATDVLVESVDTNPVLKRIFKIRTSYPLVDGDVTRVVDSSFTDFHKGLGGFTRFNKADHDKFSQKNEDKPK